MRTKTGEEISPVPGFGCLRISCGVKNTAESWKTAYSISAEAAHPVVEWRLIDVIYAKEIGCEYGEYE